MAPSQARESKRILVLMSSSPRFCNIVGFTATKRITIKWIILTHLWTIHGNIGDAFFSLHMKTTVSCKFCPDLLSLVEKWWTVSVSQGQKYSKCEASMLAIVMRMPSITHTWNRQRANPTSPRYFTPPIRPPPNQQIQYYTMGSRGCIQYSREEVHWY